MQAFEQTLIKCVEKCKESSGKVYLHDVHPRSGLRILSEYYTGVLIEQFKLPLKVGIDKSMATRYSFGVYVELI